MHHYQINHFDVESNVILPCIEGSFHTPNDRRRRLKIFHREEFDPFHQFWLIGRAFGGFLRSHDVGDGILVCAADRVKMHITSSSPSISLKFDRECAWETSLAGVCATNLGISVCTIFHGGLPLHAAAVEVNGDIIGIMAPSGVGKSTLLWSLLDSGARLVCDDMLPIMIENGSVLGMPSVSLHTKLSQEALERRDMDPNQYDLVLPDDTPEFWIPFRYSERLIVPKPLKALYYLSPQPQTVVLDGVHCQRNFSGEAMSLLMANTQGLWSVSGCFDAEKLVAQYLEILNSVPVYTLRYHRKFDVLPDLVSVITHNV